MLFTEAGQNSESLRMRTEAQALCERSYQTAHCSVQNVHYTPTVYKQRHVVYLNRLRMRTKAQARCCPAPDNALFCTDVHSH